MRARQQARRWLSLLALGRARSPGWRVLVDQPVLPLALAVGAQRRVERMVGRRPGGGSC